MAGTLVISTLSDGTNSTSSTNCIQGSAKAWVNFNGVTTTTIRGSYNVSSVTRVGSGNYTINLTNALSDANYAICTGGRQDMTYNDRYCNAYPISSSQFSIYFFGYSIGAYDAMYCMASVFR